MTNHAKNNLAHYLPTLISIIGDDSDFGWQKINSLFDSIIKKRLDMCQGQTIIVNATIFDVIIAARKNNSSALLQLDFLNRLFTDLSSILNDREKVLIRSTIKNILKSPDNTYMNFVGEIAALNNLMRTGLYRLENIEHKLDSGNKIDFLLRIISSSETILVEVVSIRLDPSRISDNKAEIEKFLNNRITQKVNSKILAGASQNFILVPILWGSSKDLKTYSLFFKNNVFKIDKVIEPLAFLSFANQRGDFLHRFARISRLFDIDPESLTNSDKMYLDGQTQDIKASA